LNRNRGITVILVTHDPDVALYTQRSLHFKDGKLQLDEKRDHPRDAALDLQQMPREQEVEEEMVSS
jgi:putative ABC transport system ATP-binding protein